MNTKEKLLNYIEKIKAGEGIDKLVFEFSKDFINLEEKDLVEILEQALEDSTKPSDLESIGDLMAGLLDLEEKIEMEEKASDQIKNKTVQQATEIGHPLNILSLENKRIDKKAKILKALIKADFPFELVFEKLKKFSEIKKHYDKKASLLYPSQVKYGTSGPSDIMWTEDDKIREDLGKLISETTKENYLSKKEEILDLLRRIREMVFKEEKIILPSSELTLSQGDWYQIYLDLKNFGLAFGELEDMPAWPRASLIEQAIKNKEKTEEKISSKEIDKEELVKFPLGQLTVEEIQSIFASFPFELTFIDKEAVNKYFPEESPIFSRPKSALFRKVYECHPPKVQAGAEKMIENLKNKKIKSFAKTSNKHGMKILVRYIGVYNKEDEFVGVMELVEDIEEYLKLEY